MTKPKGFSLLEGRLPAGSSEIVLNWLENDPVVVRLSRPRRTKLGDFKPSGGGKPPAVSVNYDLHPVEFIITLAHEMAHVENYRKHGRKVKPHGPEWKAAFRNKLGEVISSKILEDKFNRAIYMCYFRRERLASTICSDLKRLIDEEEGRVSPIRIEDIPAGSLFRTMNGKTLVKGEKVRTRYKCREFHTSRIYTVHPMAEIKDFKEPEK